MRSVESYKPIGALPHLQNNSSPASEPSQQSTAAGVVDKNLIQNQATPHLLGPLSEKLSSGHSGGLSPEMQAALAKMSQLLEQHNQKASNSSSSKEQKQASTATKPEQKEQKTTSTPTKAEQKPQAPATTKKETTTKQATYVVKRGDSLSKIARSTLGNADRWKEIYDLNRDKISNPNTIFPGQELVLPGGETKQARKPAEPPKPSTPKETKPKQEAPKKTSYVVQSGDTLSKIAQNTLGNANRWQEIYDLNRDKLSNPNNISPGQELVLPGGAKQSNQTKESKEPAQKTQGSSAHLSDPNSYFISQYRSSRNTQEDARNNGNCGPTSLTMAAMAFKKISVSPSSADQAIENTRQRMGAGTDEYSGTSYAQLVKGAQSYGLNARVVYGKLDTLKQELAQGRVVIAHVIPTYLNPKTTSTGHYALVTKVADGKVYLNDPISTSGPVVVSAESFLKGQKARGAYGLISIGD